MRKQINGLALIVQEQMQLSPFDPALFVFCNGQRRILKALYWGRTGFCLWMKRLENHRFPWPRNATEARQQIDESQLRLLLSGVLGRARGSFLLESGLKPLPPIIGLC